MDEYDIESELQIWLSDAKKLVVAGVGNQLRRDDFVGMKIIKDIKEIVSQKIYLIECETIPESYIQEIVEFNPTHLLFIDATLFGELCGSVKLLEELKDTSPAVSTHTLPLSIFFGYLRSILRAKVALLAIQPKKTGYGEGLTKEVKSSANNLAKILIRVLSKI